ncbi:hypothetical protein RND81_03G063700 [Saponaria officinalis]|uniref:BZIP domain-containing protein n=1 Tax=Saponaria officinalis TaxID=3572 RepID=A0AAW1M551_SAPOF
MASSKVMPTSSSTSTSTISDLSLLPSSSPNSIDYFHLNHTFNPNHRFHSNHLLNRDQMIPEELRISDAPSLMAGDDVSGASAAVSPMTVDTMFSNDDGNDGGDDNENNCGMLDAEITLIDAAGAISAVDCGGDGEGMRRRTAEEVWREIVGGSERRECKVEAADEMMTLEDFLARATAGEDEDAVVGAVEEGVKAEGSVSGAGMYGFDHQGMVQGVFPMAGMVAGGVAGYGNGRGATEVAVAVAGGGGGRGKRCRGNGGVMETLDKAAQQRQRRMIKNRESAARSRERKQAYQVELEALAAKLEEENEQLLREKAHRTKQRYMQLMEKIVPVVEKRRPPRTLRRVHSMQW